MNMRARWTREYENCFKASGSYRARRRVKVNRRKGVKPEDANDPLETLDCLTR